MMVRRLFLALALLTAATGAHAACNAQLRARAANKITINYTACDGVTLPAVADAVTITAGDQKIATTVVKAVANDLLGDNIQLASTAPEIESVTLINNEQTVNVTIGSATFSATVLSPTPNYLKYSWSIGPASTGDEDGNSSDSTTTTDTANAIRLQYSADYARTGLLGEANTFLGNTQTLATLSIDTTDQDSSSLIDNNEATLGLRWNIPPAGNVLKQGKLGFEGSLSKAFHTDVQDLDATVTLAGWVPVLKTLNLFNRTGDFISAPLSFKVSYGYRNRRQSGDNYHGKVFEASALYHIFAAEKYKLDLSGTWTVNDLTNRPATTPRTQSMYKATVSYLADPSTGFAVLTTIEDGSAGVMLTKVRQYFIGLAVSKLNFKGGN